MSKYKREDEKFRAQIAALADAGLTLGDKTCSIYRARPCNECEVVSVPVEQIDLTNLRGESAANLARYFSKTEYIRVGPQQTPKGRLPEFVAGMVMGALLLTGLYFVVRIALTIGGAH